MKKCIITISRQYGSGGRQIGRKLSDELAIPFYDKEVIDLAAKESGLAVDFIRGQEQQLTQSLLFSIVTNFTTASSGAFNPNMLSLSDQVYLAEAKAIRDLADKGPCVIVGRCADYILRDTADCLKVFIHADLAFRAHRIVEVYGEREQSPEERLRDKDKRRAAYHRFYTNMKWGHAQNYHLTLDSGVIGIDKWVDIIAALY